MTAFRRDKLAMTCVELQFKHVVAVRMQKANGKHRVTFRITDSPQAVSGLQNNNVYIESAMGRSCLNPS